MKDDVKRISYLELALNLPFQEVETAHFYNINYYPFRALTSGEESMPKYPNLGLSLEIVGQEITDSGPYYAVKPSRHSWFAK